MNHGWAVAAASLRGVGRLRPAPGSWGSAVVLPAVLLGPGACLAGAVLLTLAGWWALQAMPADPRAADPGWVVVDEGAGQLLALAALPAGAAWPGVLLAFVAFRLFDILKPGPVGWADRQASPIGVMLDDVIAGALAAGVMGVARSLGGF